MPDVAPADNDENLLYRRIQKALRDRIAEGAWEAGQALPNRLQLCAEFGTTRVTLDKAIQGLVREGLLRSAKGSGTFVAEPPAEPRQPPRALRIGIVLGRNTPAEEAEDTSDNNFYLGPLFSGIRDGLSGERVETIYAHLEEGDYARFYQDSALDGLILVTPTLAELPTLRQLRAENIPFVAVGISSKARLDATLPCVDTDNRQGARDAVRHLLALGHRRIAIVNLAMSHANHRDRLDGYRRALSAAGVGSSPGDLVLHPAYQAALFEPRIEDWLTQAEAAGTVPTAILACDYLMTLTTLRVLRRHGWRVPEDISVVGFDDPLSAAHLMPALTTVRQPVYRMGRRAAQRLLQALQCSEPLLGMEILPTELMVRASATRPASLPPGRELTTTEQMVTA